MIDEHLKILEKAISLKKMGINDLAWEKEDAKALINFLMDDTISVLGGDVYKVIGTEILPLSDNWSCEYHYPATSKEQALKSKIKSLDYINNYPVSSDEKVLFSLTFDEYIC